MTETTSSIFMIISSAFIILCGEEKHRKRETRIYYQSSDQIKYDIRLCSKESALGAFELRSAFPAKYNMKSQLKYNKEKSTKVLTQILFRVVTLQMIFLFSKIPIRNKYFLYNWIKTNDLKFPVI